MSTQVTVITGSGSTAYTVNLDRRGPQGIQGIQGIQGETGPQGQMGVTEWNALTGTIDIVPFTTTNGEPQNLGELTWFQDEETLSLRLKGDTLLEIGEKTLYHVENNTGTTIAKGAPVMYSGTVGNSGKLRVKPWDGTDPKAFMGIATMAITGAEGTGYVTHFGKIKGIQTNGGNYGQSWASGNIIYAVTGSANLTNVAPTAGGYVVVAVVVSASANNGTLFVRPTQVPSLTEIGAAATVHTHVLSDITNAGTIASQNANNVTITGGSISGITDLAIADGGTGASTADNAIGNLFPGVASATEKTTAVDADLVAIADSAASSAIKRLTLANLWAYVTTKIGAITSITASGAWSFSSTTRPTSSGTGSAAATSLVTRADVEGLVGYNYLPFNSSMILANYNTGTPTRGLQDVTMQLITGTTGTASLAGYMFAAANNQGFLPYLGNEAQISWNQKFRFRFGVSQLVLDGDGVVWIWIGSNPAGSAPSGADPPVTTGGYGIRFDKSGGNNRVTAVTYGGGAYIYGTPANINTPDIITLDVSSGTLNVINSSGTTVATVSGGPTSADGTNDAITIIAQSTLANGFGNNYARFRANRFEFRYN